MYKAFEHYCTYWQIPTTDNGQMVNNNYYKRRCSCSRDKYILI